MKTYKVETVKAASLRKQLLWTNVVSFFAVILATMFGVGAAISSGGAGAGGLAILFGIVAIVTSLWSIVAYWRALWALWEWPGILMGIGVAAGVIILNALAAPVGMFLSLAFLIYVFVQLGKQSGDVVVSKREVFEE
jgi:hypothetical protein